MIFGQMMMGGDENQNCFYFKLATTWKQKTASGVHSRRIYRGAVNLFLDPALLKSSKNVVSET